MQDVIRLCQQEQSVDNYTERVIIVGLQCINPSLQRWKHIWELSGAKINQALLYRNVEKSDMVRWVRWFFIIFSISGRVHVWHTPKEQYRPECLTPTVRGSSGSVMLWGAFCWHGLGPLVPLEGKVTANQYKVVLSDHLYPMMKHFYTPY